MINKIKKLIFISFLIPLSIFAVDEGLYELHNHPDGNQAPPLYGMRLDHLFDVPSSTADVFTFDFDHADSAMFLDYSGTSINIFGTVFGGLDTGTMFDPAYSGLWGVDFTYNNVSMFAGDDDVGFMGASGSNFGFIVPLFSSADMVITALDFVDLTDASNGDFTFRFGDENDDLGHRGFDGLSGWGWLDFLETNGNGGTQDWLFTAERIEVPEPSTYLLLACFLCAAMLLKSKRAQVTVKVKKN